jgi:hypothetical protein
MVKPITDGFRDGQVKVKSVDFEVRDAGLQIGLQRSQLNGRTAVKRPRG